MYELIVIWDNPIEEEKQIYYYQTEEDARKAENGFRKAFGNQIKWTGIRRKL